MDQFARFKAASEQALIRTGAVQTAVRIADCDVSLCFGGDSLSQQMMPAFEHVTSVSTAPSAALAVTIWDSTTSHTSLPIGIGSPPDHSWSGLGKLRRDGRILSLFDAEGGLSMLDTETGEAINWLPDARRLSERSRAAPLQAILSWWLPSRNRPVVHAAAVGTGAGAVLLFGNSGAGKSMTAMSCIDDGFLYLGDDLCALSMGEGGPTVHSIYCSAKIFQHHLQEFPGFARLANRDALHSDKAVGYITTWRSGCMRQEMPVIALVVLGQKGAPSPMIAPLKPIKALGIIGSSTIFNLPGPSISRLDGLRRLVDSIPCFAMELSSDLAANPLALRRLIEQCTAPANA